MTVFPFSYRFTDDFVLVRTNASVPLRKVENFTFDGLFQFYSSAEAAHKQFNERLIFALKNSAISLFFAFDFDGKLHLFNSRHEVTRFLKEIFM